MKKKKSKAFALHFFSALRRLHFWGMQVPWKKKRANCVPSSGWRRRSCTHSNMRFFSMHELHKKKCL